MAGDWIKMRTDLYRDPKVCVMADLLLDPEGDLARHVSKSQQCDMSVTRYVMRNAVVGALLSLWGVMRHRGKRSNDDLVCKSVTASVLDDIAEMPGFGEAMQHVGWAEQTEEGVVFPNFFKAYNSEPSKAPADRQRRYRERKRASRVTSPERNAVTARYGEKRERREEKSKDKTPPNPPEGGATELVPVVPTFPPNLDTPDFRAAWAEWEAERRAAKRKAYTPVGRQRQLDTIAAFGPDVAIIAIQESIRNGWAGLFPDKVKPGDLFGNSADRVMNDVYDTLDNLRKTGEGDG